MAAVATAMPMLVAPIPPKPRVKGAAFDPDLLSRKLEAHRQAQEHARQRNIKLGRRRSHDSIIPTSRHHGYVPQTAAAQFSLTAAPLSDNKSARKKNAAALEAAKQFSMKVDTVRNYNPKQLVAGLSLGMSESEVIAAMSHMTAVPHRRRGSDSSIHLKPSLQPSKSIRDPNHARSRSRRPAQDGSMPIIPAPLDLRKRPSKRHAPVKETASPSPITPTELQFYRPGDAAKRNDDKRCSYLLPIVTTDAENVEPESFWKPIIGLLADENIALPRTTYRNKENASPYDMWMPEMQKIVIAKGKDRHDWAQASEFGDDAPVLKKSSQLRDKHGRRQKLPTLRRRKSDEKAQTTLSGTSSPEVTRPATANAAVVHTVPGRLDFLNTEHETAGNTSDEKEKEKERKKLRRKSIAGFFKRH